MNNSLSDNILKFIFLSDIKDLGNLYNHYLTSINKRFNNIINIEVDNINILNVIQELDNLFRDLKYILSLFNYIRISYKDKKFILKSSFYYIETINVYLDIVYNDKFFKFLNYIRLNLDKYNFDIKEFLLLENILRIIENIFFNYSFDLKDELLSIYKKINKLIVEFEDNLILSNYYIKLSQDQLLGLEKEFIDDFDYTNGLYNIKVNSYNCHYILLNSKLESTRKIIWQSFVSIAYPRNEIILNEILALKNNLFNILKSKNSSNILFFNRILDDCFYFFDYIFNLNLDNIDKYYSILKDNLPDDNIVIKDNKINPWDIEYIKNNYINNKFFLFEDNSDLFKEFSIDFILNSLNKIFLELFNISISKLDILLYKDIVILNILDNSGNQDLGYIILDLYSSNIYLNNICNLEIINPSFLKNIEKFSLLNIIVGNFNRYKSNKYFFNLSQMFMIIYQISSIILNIKDSLNGYLIDNKYFDYIFNINKRIFWIILKDIYKNCDNSKLRIILDKLLKYQSIDLFISFPDYILNNLFYIEYYKIDKKLDIRKFYNDLCIKYKNWLKYYDNDKSFYFSFKLLDDNDLNQLYNMLNKVLDLSYYLNITNFDIFLNKGFIYNNVFNKDGDFRFKLLFFKTIKEYIKIF